MQKTKVAILGTGNIGTDLLIKVLRSPFLECSAFIGRNLSSPGMAKAKALGVPVSADGIDLIDQNPSAHTLVFDATSAKDHENIHAPIFAKHGLVAIDLTPAKVGIMCVPAVNMAECLGRANVNMVTCGGQASIPVAHAIAETHTGIDYIEVVSSIASRSAGPATRKNLDEYIHTTEEGIRAFGKSARSKAILNLNPAQPCINMQTTIFAKVEKPDIDRLKPVLEAITRSIRRYVPGYEVLVGPTIENGRIVVMVRVKGLGDYLPAYAGNLDIINCAAVATAEAFAKRREEGAAR